MSRTHHTVELTIPYRTKPDLRTLRGPINKAVKSSVDRDRWHYDGRRIEISDLDGSLKLRLRFEPTARASVADRAKLARSVRRAVASIAIDQPGSTEPQPTEPQPTEPQPTEPQPTELMPSPEPEPEPAPDMSPPPINVERGTNFDHIYDRSAQVSILLSAIRAAVESDFQVRFHTILFGPPGCGKTEILRSAIAMLGPSHVLLLDGPSTTKAGAEQLLMGVKRIQPFVLIEEIEKMHPAHMQWLLGLLDERGEVRRTNARDGHVQRDARMLCIATVNDMLRFRALMFGALSSRFSHEIYCPRPDTDVLSKIAHREVARIGGNPFWVNAAVNYCVHVEGTYDPRRVVSVCLSGRDALLDGTYQRALLHNRMLQQQAANNEKK
jgi:hypothetical protein